MGGGVAKGSGKKEPIVLSEADPYGAQPPRLIAAINDTKTDSHPDAKMGNYLEARAKTDAARSAQPMGPQYGSKVGAAMAKADVPLGHVIHIEELPSIVPHLPKSIAK